MTAGAASSGKRGCSFQRQDGAQLAALRSAGANVRTHIRKHTRTHTGCAPHCCARRSRPLLGFERNCCWDVQGSLADLRVEVAAAKRLSNNATAVVAEMSPAPKAQARSASAQARVTAREQQQQQQHAPLASPPSSRLHFVPAQSPHDAVQMVFTHAQASGG